MPDLTYTRDLPTEPGWYWCKVRKNGRAEVREVIEYRNSGRRWITEPTAEYPYRLLGETGYRWFAGPLKEPK